MTTILKPHEAQSYAASARKLVDSHEELRARQVRALHVLTEAVADLARVRSYLVLRADQGGGVSRELGDVVSRLNALARDLGGDA